MRHFRHIYGIAVLLVMSVFIAGCDSGGDSNPVRYGVFADSPVEGLNYVTASTAGKTDATGRFSYFETDKTISFYIGKPEDKGVFIGISRVGSEVTPMDLVQDTSKDVLGNEVTNISRLLQSLDTDGIPENGITITAQAAEALKGEVVNFDVDPTTFGDQLGSVFSALNAKKVFADKRTLKTPAQARRHLRESLGLTVDAATAQKLQGAMDKVLAKYPWPGIVMGVRFPDGKTWFGAKGVADIANNIPMTIDHRLRIGSITKTFTATVILQMAEEGWLSLDDTVEKWLPGILGDYQYHDQITIRQLLNHTSGLNNYWHLSMDPESLYYQEYFGGTWKKLWDPRDLVEETISLPALFAPGAGWAYSNIGPILEAMIVEKITGDRFETVMTQRILDMLGLYNTYLPGDENLVAPHARGYLDYTNLNGVYDAGDDCTNMNPSFAWASGAVVTSIEDLLRYGTALAGGEMIGTQYQAERLKMVNIRPDGSAQSGLGIMLVNGALGHNGDIFGFQATVQRYKNVDFAVITNAQGLFDPAAGEPVFIPEDPSTGNISYVTFKQAIEDLGLTTQ